MAAVDHYGRESVVDAGFAKLEAVAVIKVEYDLRIFPAELFCVCYSALGHVAEQGCVGVVARAFRHLQALMIAWSCSMLLKLKAGMAYPPLMALANISRVLTRPNSL